MYDDSINYGAESEVLGLIDGRVGFIVGLLDDTQIGAMVGIVVATETATYLYIIYAARRGVSTGIDLPSRFVVSCLVDTSWRGDWAVFRG